MDDVICIEGIRIPASVGVYPYEAGLRQPLKIDLRLSTDIRGASTSDELTSTVNYERVVAIAREIVQSRHHNLIETIAEKIAARVLADFEGQVAAVHIRVAKPGAVPETDTVAIEIARTAE